MSIQSKIELSPEHQAALRKLKDSQQGMQNFMQSMINAGEARAAAMQQQGRELFESIATIHGIDLKTQTWVPSEDGKSIELISVRYDYDR